VKHPERFEKEFIPQFFKHSKFSSFVRQLNFYGFRKLKYSDNIRIDPKDAETANYWRFKHEHFVRGKPDLLKNIRRSQSSQAIPITDKPYEQPEKKPEEVELLRCEVDVLKDRIAKMSANIDELTGLVNKITITDDNHASAGSKRKLVKVEEVCSLDDCKSDDVSFAGPMIVATDEDMDHISLEPDTVLSSFYATPANLCSTSSMSSISPSRNISLLPEDDFVDDLFASFSDDPIEAFPDPVTSMTISSQLHSIHTESNMLQDKSSPVSKIHPNAPDPALIARLSEALTILPKDVQELLVNRLIATITASDSLMNHLDAVYKSSPESCKNQEHKNNPCVSIPYISIHA
jgi:heat shock transcription factor 2